MPRSGKIAILVLMILNCAGNKNAGKLSFIALEEELRMGDEFAVQAAQKLKILRNAEINAYFNGIAKTIGSQSDWSGLEYKVYIVNTPEVNHFSLPGGGIYIYRGLIEAADSLDEVALAIAHEIAHICARDGVERMAAKYGYAFAAQSVVGDNPEIPGQIVEDLYRSGTILDYSKEAEFRADARALKYAWKAHFQPKGWLKMIQKIRQLQINDPSLVTLLMATHPSSSARCKKVQNELNFLPDMPELVQNTPKFLFLKDLLQRLPR
jgi:beta-barrel assembly-enhancing protease